MDNQVMTASELGNGGKRHLRTCNPRTHILHQLGGVRGTHDVAMVTSEELTSVNRCT